MATAGIINATNLKLYAGVGLTLVAACKSAQLSVSNEEMGATTKDSAGWYQFLPGMRSWEISGDAFYQNVIATYEFYDLFTLITNRTSIAVTFGTSVTGDYYYTGTCYVTSLSINAGTEDNATYSMTLKGTGALTKATYVGE